MPDPDHQTADAIAQACAEKMLEGDRVSQSLGIRLLEAAAGRAALEMTIRADMLNGFGSCHGGVLFTLADTALSCACNSHNERAVAHHCTIIYLRPGKPGERLVATALERATAGRVGLYDVRIRDWRGAAIGEFLGHARVIGGPVLTASPLP